METIFGCKGKIVSVANSMRDTPGGKAAGGVVQSIRSVVRKLTKTAQHAAFAISIASAIALIIHKQILVIDEFSADDMRAEGGVGLAELVGKVEHQLSGS